MTTNEAVAKLPSKQMMEITDELGAKLHHRSVLGEELSETDREMLQSWYEAQDRLEAEQLGLASRRRSVTELEERINSLVQQLSETIRLNNEIAAHNSAMLSEIVALQNVLPSSHSAPVAR